MDTQKLQDVLIEATEDDPDMALKIVMAAFVTLVEVFVDNHKLGDSRDAMQIECQVTGRDITIGAKRLSS